MGLNPRRSDHVPRSDHAYCLMGCDTKRVGHLLRLESVLLRYRCRRRISHDCNIRYGECGRIRQDQHERRPSAPWTKGHECLLDARMGTIFQPDCFDPPSHHLPSWKVSLDPARISCTLLTQAFSGNAPYSQLAVQWTYRVSFAIPAVGTLWLVYYRVYKMRAASKQLNVAKRKSKVTGYDTQSLKLTFTYFGPRLIATAGGWYANDIFFYGNKLFQGTFITAIIGKTTSLMPNWLYSLLNIGISLCGYYLACKPENTPICWFPGTNRL